MKIIVEKKKKLINIPSPLHLEIALQFLFQPEIYKRVEKKNLTQKNFVYNYKDSTYRHNWACAAKYQVDKNE